MRAHSTPLRQRRGHTVAATLAIMLLAAISGCGWQLRTAPNLPPEMTKVYVEGMSRKSRFVRDLNESLSFAGGGVTRKPDDAGIILKVLDERFERRVASLSAEGKATEYELIYTLFFKLQNPDESDLLPAQTIEIHRAYFNPQVRVIGKNQEENQIRREMYKEAVRTLLRRAEIALSHNHS